ncbi:MAG: hypothetical protein AAGC55_01675 [Myxococcota bacterium]
MALLLALWLGPGSARGDDDDGIERIKLAFAERNGSLAIKRLGLSSLLFDERAYRGLKEKGLATTIVVRLYVYRVDRVDPVALRLMTVRVVYDLWSEKYVVRINSPAGVEDSSFKRLDQAFRKMTEFANVPIAALDEIAIGPHYYFAMIAELNPVSEETRAAMRRWLRRPAGTNSLSRETSFFGAFVSIFVNTPPAEADRVVRARSQNFYRVAR